jgi:hypothetical protein
MSIQLWLGTTEGVTVVAELTYGTAYSRMPGSFWDLYQVMPVTSRQL